MSHTTGIVVIYGARAGLVVDVRDHPHGERIRLSYVDLGDGRLPVQIVFGGQYRVQVNDLVPVAPPGAKVVVEQIPPVVPRLKKMRNRRYRGMRSHGMLCSLNELGWAFEGPDEVATLRNIAPGETLDGLSYQERLDKVDRHRSLVVPPKERTPLWSQQATNGLRLPLAGQSDSHEVDRSAANR